MLDKARNGYFKVEELKAILVQMGEALEESEFKEFMKILKVKADGTVNTEGIWELLFQCFGKADGAKIDLVDRSALPNPYF